MLLRDTLNLPRFIKIIGQLMVISKISLHAKPEEYQKKGMSAKRWSHELVLQLCL